MRKNNAPVPILAIGFLFAIGWLAYTIWFHCNHTGERETITVTVTAKKFVPRRTHSYTDSDGNISTSTDPERYYVWLQYKDLSRKIDSERLYGRLMIGNSYELECTLWINKKTQRIHSFDPIGYGGLFD